MHNSTKLQVINFQRRANSYSKVISFVSASVVYNDIYSNRINCREASLIVSNASGLEECDERHKYTLLFCYPNKGKLLKINVANISSKKLGKVLVFGKDAMKSDRPVAN